MPVDPMNAPGAPSVGASGAEAPRETAERAALEARLEEVERRLDLLVNHAPVVLWTLDREKRFTSALGRYLGPPEDVARRWVGAHLEEALDGFPEIIARHERALAGETVTGLVEWHGRHFATCYTPTRTAEGEITGVVCVGTDVTEQHHAAESFRKSEELNRRIIDIVPGGIVMAAPNGRIYRANQAAIDFLGLTWEELGQRYVSDFDGETIGEDGRPVPSSEYPVSKCLSTRQASPPATIGVVRRDGIVRWGAFNAVPLTDPKTNAFLGALVTFTDISDRKQTEEDKRRLLLQLAQAQKLEALGRLAGGVAHDFNNLLTGILGHASVLKESTEPGSEAHVSCQIIERAAERAAVLTQQLLGFARRGKNQDVPFDMNWSVAEAVAFLTRALDKKFELLFFASSDPCVVRGDPNQIQQVIANLALNARDAMPQGGEIRFRVERVDVREAEARDEPDARPGRFVVLSVEDQGTGIPPDIRRHVFEPFFTTKTHGKGTGMGLPMVYGIARNHSGWVAIDSEVGRGTTVRVFLPASDLSPPEEGDERPMSLKRAPARILVVDDEELVRTTATALLRSANHRVDVAPGGEQAVAIYAAGHGGFDLVLLDLSMPKMDGQACFRELKRIDPNVRVLISTGYDPGDGLQSLLEEGVRGFVLKPYRRRELLEAVERCLSERPSPPDRAADDPNPGP